MAREQRADERSEHGWGFGDALRHRREEAGLSQEQLAERAGLSAKAIGALERGERRRPHPRTVDLLATALGLTPEERRALVAAVLGSGVAAAPGPPSVGLPPLCAGPRHNLPQPLTSFVGRERDVAALRVELLRPQVRLLTLTGPAGVGKTRLALQAGREMVGAFADGVVFVALAAIRDSSLVTPAIAHGLGIQEVSRRPVLDRLVDYLQDKQLLLLLDNFEQVVAAAPQVAALLTGASHLKILVTSRGVLHLSGEHDFAVPPLDLPTTGKGCRPEQLTHFGAVQLFVERARATRSDFALTAENATAVGEICNHLDGLPLAIELAAARIRALSPQSILARLENRFRLLTGGPRDLPLRQQTLRNAIAWSYELLNPAEQRLFRRLGVFAGGCTLEMVEAVCNATGDLDVDVLDGMDSVVSQSLVRRDDRADGETRFGMLETLREYALEQLREAGEDALIRQRHARSYLALMVEAGPHLFRAEQLEWWRRLDSEVDNVRIALAWDRAHPTTFGPAAAGIGASGAAVPGERLVGALWHFWFLRGRWTEGRRFAEDLLADRAAAIAPPARAALLFAASHLAYSQGDFEPALAHADGCRALCLARDDQAGLGYSRIIPASVAYGRGDYRAAQVILEEVLSLIPEEGETWGIAHRWMVAASKAVLGICLALRGDHARAERLGQEALAVARAMGDRQAIAVAAMWLGRMAMERGDLAAARERLGVSVALFREVGNRGRVSSALSSLALATLLAGDAELARGLYAEVLGLARELGEKRAMIEPLAGFAGLSRDPARVARLLGAEEALSAAVGVKSRAEEQALIDRLVATTRSQLAPDAFATAWAEGRSMTLDQAVACALEEYST